MITSDRLNKIKNFVRSFSMLIDLFIRFMAWSKKLFYYIASLLIQFHNLILYTSLSSSQLIISYLTLPSFVILNANFSRVFLHLLWNYIMFRNISILFIFLITAVVVFLILMHIGQVSQFNCFYRNVILALNRTVFICKKSYLIMLD